LAGLALVCNLAVCQGRFSLLVELSLIGRVGKCRKGSRSPASRQGPAGTAFAFALLFKRVKGRLDYELRGRGSVLVAVSRSGWIV